MKEPMVSIVWPNGYVAATRKSMADRIVKKKQARYLTDVNKETLDAEAEAEAKAKAAKAKATVEDAKAKAKANKDED